MNNHDKQPWWWHIYIFNTIIFLYITQINKMNLFNMGKHSTEHMKISHVKPDNIKKSICMYDI